MKFKKSFYLTSVLLSFSFFGFSIYTGLEITDPPIKNQSNTSFYFQLKVDNEVFSFWEVSGLETEVITEGGGYIQKHTGVITNLELKRGIVPANSNFYNWVYHTLNSTNGNRTQTKNVQISLISLMDESGIPRRSWIFDKAFPVSLNSAYGNNQNEIYIESISFAYAYSNRIF